MRLGKPLFGICFGSQILGRALGFGTYKLGYGHRGINQPVLDKTTGKVRGDQPQPRFAVDAPVGAVIDTEFGGVEVSHVCLNDNVVEGCGASTSRVHRSVTTRGGGGPHDADYLFDRSWNLWKRRAEPMPKRTDLRHVMVIGSGPIVIGQACEFDYSGTQACRCCAPRGCASRWSTPTRPRS